MLPKTLFFVSCLRALSYAEVPAENVEQNETKTHPDVGLRVPELVEKYGYPLEVHTVVTTDGYILSLHRIPHGRNNSGEKNKPVVFLMHCLLCSSAIWVMTGPEKGLAYLSADIGYDVWMGNARGNTYSRAHLTLDPNMNKKKFWNFSFHEIGVTDLPNMIDYVLKQTEEKQLHYIGHSQGTTTFFVMASTRPEYNEKIKLMVALAPVAYMNNIPNFAFRLIAESQEVVGWVVSMLGVHEFLPSTEFMQLIGQSLCNDESIVQDICSNVLFLVAGYNSEQLNKTVLPVILSNTPAGASTKQLIHYGQQIKSGKFRQFDYKSENIFKYGQRDPPDYDLSKVTVPVAIFYGANDALASEVDIERMRKEIVRPILYYKIKDDKFNHLDFLWSIDVVPLLYEIVFDLLEKY